MLTCLRGRAPPSGTFATFSGRRVGLPPECARRPRTAPDCHQRPRGHAAPLPGTTRLRHVDGLVPPAERGQELNVRHARNFITLQLAESYLTRRLAQQILGPSWTHRATRVAAHLTEPQTRSEGDQQREPNQQGVSKRDGRVTRLSSAGLRMIHASRKWLPSACRKGEWADRRNGPLAQRHETRHETATQGRGTS
jgi:hypothetical protein